jgi:hypothetical protein
VGAQANSGAAAALAALLGWSCARPAAAPAPRSPAAAVAPADWTAITVEDPLRVPEFVVLSGLATLHERPSDDSAAFVAAPSTLAPSEWAYVREEDLRVFTFAGQRGDWVAIDTALYGPTHCYPDPAPLRGMRLRFYVRASELLRVTVRDEELSVPEGTLSLAAGVVLVRAASPEYAGADRPVLDHPTALVHVPAEATGFRYTLDFSKRGNKPCGVLTRAIPPPPAPRSRGGGLVDLLGPLDTAHGHPFRFGIRAGAIAYWPSGRPAGTAVRKTIVGDEVESAGGRRCFEAWMDRVPKESAPSREQILHLCFAPTDVAADDRNTDVFRWQIR